MKTTNYSAATDLQSHKRKQEALETRAEFYRALAVNAALRNILSGLMGFICAFSFAMANDLAIGKSVFIGLGVGSILCMIHRVASSAT